MKTGPLKLIKTFFKELELKEIKYCHWKSNKAISRTLSGDADIDILVYKKDKIKFEQVLLNLEFKRALASLRKEMYGIEDYIGFDIQTGKLFHLHIHYSLILGEKNIKNHSWPIEQYLLDNKINENGINLINPNIELVILFVRTFLKVDLIDISKKLLKQEDHYFPLNIIDEYRFLLTKGSEKTLRAAQKDLIPHIQYDHFYYVVNNINRLSLIQIISLKRKVLKNMKMYERVGALKKNVQKILQYSLKNRFAKKIDKNIGKKILPAGGISIALVGPDGSGKSTQVKIIEKWLREQFQTYVFYMGSGDGKKDFILFLLEYCKNKIVRNKKNKSPKHEIVDDKHSLFNLKNLYFLLRSILIARQRLKNVIISNKMKSAGKIILYDRFPQTDIYGINDGPKIEDSKYKIISFFHQTELSIYNKIMKLIPDKYILLTIDPKECHRRKPDHDFENIVLKIQVLINQYQSLPQLFEKIDAQQSREDVSLNIKKIIWKCI
jgi:thymidylate kinase